MEEDIKAGAEVEKSGDPDGSPVSHTFANVFKKPHGPRLALFPHLYFLARYSSLLFVDYCTV